MTHTLSAPQAAEIIGVDHSTLFRWVSDGLLPAERQGLKRTIIINPDDLRRFAQAHNYPFDERKISQ